METLIEINKSIEGAVASGSVKAETANMQRKERSKEVPSVSGHITFSRCQHQC